MSAEAAEAAEAATGQETTEPDNINVGLVATITIVGALLVVATAAALTALVRSESTSYGFETGTYANLGTVKRLKAEQRAKLEQPIGWADKAKQQVALPIDRAMEIVREDIQRDPFHATIAPAVAPAPEPAAAPSGAAPAGSAAPAPGTPPASSGAAAEKPAPHGKRTPAAGGKLVDPPSGAPVTPAAAPAPKP